MGTFRYKAFVSYSHRDRKWGSWLQRSLEAYRVPKRLVGTETAFGPVERRLTPVFRDREDLPSASDLSSKVKEALAASATLIVVCSPAAAESKWVNEEVRYFRSLGREERIFALIVDGDPQPDDPVRQCFPAALTTWPDGTPHEPLAADVRKWADGKQLAKLKLVSGILGIRLDDLRQRELQRRRRNWILACAGTVAALVVTGTLVFTTVSSQKTVRLQRSNTEELLSYMLGNLKQLNPIVGLEVIDQQDEQTLEYFRSLGIDQMDNDELTKKGLEWREQGQDYHERGNLDEAMEYFKKSRAAFIELYQRKVPAGRALFELGQAEFWVGYVNLDKGELDEAQERFTRYGVITRRLINENPKDAEMVMELSYTLTNLGAVERARVNPDTVKARQLTESAVQYNQIALVLDPENSTYRLALNNKLAFMADAWLESCDLGRAYVFRQQNVDLSRELYQHSPQNEHLKLVLASSLSGLAAVQQRIPMPKQALLNLQESRDLFLQLAQEDIENPLFHWDMLMREHRMLRIRSWKEPAEKLWPEMRAHRKSLDHFFLEAGLQDYSAAVDYAETLVDYSGWAWRVGEKEEADRTLKEATDRLSDLVAESPANRKSQRLLASAWFEYWSRHGSLPFAVAMLDDYLVDPQTVNSCDDAGLAARLEWMRGNISRARDYTLYLLDKGFFEPGFVAFCQSNGLCNK